jgi:peptidoglycan glycosyltransferase
LTRALRRLVNLVLVGYAIALAGATYWQLVAAPTLTTDLRFNGYRAAQDMKRNIRGRILDRNGEPLAVSQKGKDGYERTYPYAGAAPIVGYWSLRYGSAGLEGEYDQQLRGEQNAGVDAVWQRLLREPVVGADVVTTIDLRLQRAADEALGSATGAAIAIDPRSGEVLALASHPYYDPNQVEASYQKLRDDPSDPLYNRALDGLYVPGSTFKVVTYTAGLADGVVRPDTVYEDPDNGIVVDHYRIPDPNHPGMPRYDYRTALAVSSNSAFADLAMKLGRDRLQEQARRFGFEAPIPFDLPTHASHLWQDPNFLWTRLGLATTGMGQGQILASPIQMALVAAGIANGGQIMRPRLVREVRAADGTVLERAKPEAFQSATSPQVAQMVTDAMVLGVRQSWAKTAALPNVQVAGKTGTAETDADAIPHAWFIAFAPAEKPRIAVAVIEEHAGGGSTYAGPVVKRMLEVGLQVVAP